jgi:uracil-DNA glycosylase
LAVLLSQLASVELPDVFNPYADRCPVADLPDAPLRRRSNLCRCLIATMAGEANGGREPGGDGGVDALWIGRDLGYRGGRRTGLPLTDEVRLPLAAARAQVAPFARATRGPAAAERTAGHVWAALAGEPGRVLLWNVFPWHPHRPGMPFSNRPHSRREAELGLSILHQVIELARPRRIVAIGRDAREALARTGIAAVAVRHPSHGGHAAFAAGIAAGPGGGDG